MNEKVQSYSTDGTFFIPIIIAGQIHEKQKPVFQITRRWDFATHPDFGCYCHTKKGCAHSGCLTGFIVWFTVIHFYTIDIIENLGILAISEILADRVTRPKKLNANDLF